MDLFNTAAGNGIKQLKSFISHPTASFLVTKCNGLFGLQNCNENLPYFDIMLVVLDREIA